MPYGVNIEGIGEISVADDATDLNILQDALIAKMQAGQVSDHDAQLSYLEGLVEQGYQQPQPQIEEPAQPKEGPDRGYFMEALAGIGSGALHTLGAGMSGIERLAERMNIDPSGKDAGWLRQAGEYLKEGGEQIKASPDLPEWYFKTFNAFGSVLGFAAPALVVSPLGGLPSLALAGTMGVGAGADEAYERAEQAGATEEQIDSATYLGGGVGLSEIAAPIKALRSMAKLFPNVFRGSWQGKGLGQTSVNEIRKATTEAVQGDRLAKAIGVDPRPFRAFGKRMALTAGLEGSQEAVAAIAQNAIEKYIYNPDADLANMEALEEGLYGGSAGAMLEGVLSVFTARKSRKVRKRFNELMDSEPYKQMQQDSDAAVSEYEAAEEGSAEQQAAAEKIIRADAMIEGMLLQDVWGSKDAVDYLKEQTAPDGTQLYSNRMFEEIDKIGEDQLEIAANIREKAKEEKDPEKKKEDEDLANTIEMSVRLRRNQALKDLYMKHVNDPNTKYEGEAEEVLFDTVNPYTNSSYTYDEVQNLKAEKKGIALEAEAKARAADAERGDPLEIQQAKINLRMRHQASVNKLNEVQDNLGNDFILAIQTLREAARAPNLIPDLRKRLQKEYSTKILTDPEFLSNPKNVEDVIKFAANVENILALEEKDPGSTITPGSGIDVYDKSGKKKGPSEEEPSEEETPPSEEETPEEEESPDGEIEGEAGAAPSPAEDATDVEDGSDGIGDKETPANSPKTGPQDVPDFDPTKEEGDVDEGPTDIVNDPPESTKEAELMEVTFSKEDVARVEAIIEEELTPFFNQLPDLYEGAMWDKGYFPVRTIRELIEDIKAMTPLPSSFTPSVSEGVKKFNIHEFMNSPKYFGSKRGIWDVRGEKPVGDISWMNSPAYRAKQIFWWGKFGVPKPNTPAIDIDGNEVRGLRIELARAAQRVEKELGQKYPKLYERLNEIRSMGFPHNQSAKLAEELIRPLYDGWFLNRRELENLGIESLVASHRTSDNNVDYQQNLSGTASTKPTWNPKEFEKIARNIMTIVGLNNSQKGTFDQGVDQNGNPSFIWRDEVDPRDAEQGQETPRTSVRNVIFVTKKGYRGSYGSFTNVEGITQEAPYRYSTLNPKSPFHYGAGSVVINVNAITRSLPEYAHATGMESVDTWAAFLNTSHHEAFHAAKALTLTPEQKKLWDELVTVELAQENGVFDSDRQTSYLNSYKLNLAKWKVLAEANNTWSPEAEAEARKRLVDDALLEEAQAHLFGAWASGKELKGVTPPARRLMELIHEFLHKAGNFLKFKGYVVSDAQMLQQDQQRQLEQRRTQLLREFANGTTARQAGRLAPNEAAAFAREYVPTPYEPETALEKILTKVMGGGFGMKGGNLSAVGPDGVNNGWQIAKDISIFSSIFSHMSDIARKNPLFNRYYNLIQDRIKERNVIKLVGDTFLEQVGGAGGVLKLNEEGIQEVSHITIFGDEVGVDPTFENLGTDQATVTLKIPVTRLQEAVNRYDPDGTTDGQRFFKDTGINPQRLSDAYVEKDAKGNDVQYVNYEVTDSKIANAFGGSYKATEHVGNELFRAILYNVLNTGDMKGKTLGMPLDVKGKQGEVRIEDRQNFRQVQDQLEAIMKKAEELELIVEDKETGELVFDIEKYKAYKAQALKEGVQPADILFGELKDTATGQSKRSQVEEIYTLLNLLHGEKRRGYFPHYRFGDHAVVVKKKGAPGEADIQVRFETVESNLSDAMGGVPFVGDALEKRLKNKQNELAAKLKREYGDGYIVEPLEITMDSLRSGSSENAQAVLKAMGVMESLGGIFTGEAYADNGNLTPQQLQNSRQSAIDSFLDMARGRITLSRAQAIVRERKNIPGYINEGNNTGDYFKRALQRYIDSGANTASSLLIEPDLLSSMQDMASQIGENSRVHKLAEDTFKYINNPRNEATQLRGMAFHMFLGFNFSSAVINLTQTPQVTFPILSSIAGPVKGASATLGAGRDALRLYKHMLMAEETGAPRLGKYGFEFFTTDEAGNAVVDMSRKPQWMDEKEFTGLAHAFAGGTIQPIQNMDLGAGEINKLIGSGTARTFFDASGYSFGLVENVNRITAYLAAARLAREGIEKSNTGDNKLLDRMRAYSKSTRFGDAANRLDINEDPEAFIHKMGEMAVEKTQFYMGKENRPWMFRGGPMSLITQFMSFPFQVLGLYADTLKKSLGASLGEFDADTQAILRSAARQQFALMALMTMSMGGAMGLPFMENIKQLVRLISENFGDEVGEDLEQGMREIMGPVFGYNPTDMILRGLPRGIGLDVSRRTGYGDIIPLRLLMGGDPTDFTGPAVSRLVDMVAGFNEALEQSQGIVETAGALAVNASPIAIGNLYRALIKEPNRGTFTQRGQALLPPDSLTGTERAAYALGFQPTTVSRARERRGMENYYQYRARNGKERYTQRLSNSLTRYMSSLQNGDVSSAMNAYSNYLNDYLTAMQHDMDNLSDPTKQYRINMDSVFNRAERALNSMGFDTGPRVSKAVRPKITEGILKGYIPYRGTG